MWRTTCVHLRPSLTCEQRFLCAHRWLRLLVFNNLYHYREPHTLVMSVLNGDRDGEKNHGEHHTIRVLCSTDFCNKTLGSNLFHVVPKFSYPTCKADGKTFCLHQLPACPSLPHADCNLCSAEICHCLFP